MDDDRKKLLELERQRRLVLADRIAHALAVLDPDPDPARLDPLLDYCRVCRLIERYRAASALVEHDPDLLKEAGTQHVVQSLRADIEKHVGSSGHDPLVEAIRALSTSVAREDGNAAH